MGHKKRILVNVSTIGMDDLLEALSEAVAHILDVLGTHGGPGLVHRCLESIHTVVALLTGLRLHEHLDGVIQEVEVRALGRPEVLGPEVHVLMQPVLSLFGGVGRCSMLLKDPWRVPNYGFDPQEHFGC